jgi:hypothetical protein
VGDNQYIWITRWGDFQHYAPERDRAPAWIKNYTKQLDDERYTSLTPRRRALLTDLRLVFARTSQQLLYNTRTLSGRILVQVRDDDIQALVHTGLIELISRETLEQRLEELYNSSRPNSRPRTRPRTREEVEEEVLRTSSKRALESRSDERDSRAPTKTLSGVCPECEVGGGLHSVECPTLTSDNGDIDW